MYPHVNVIMHLMQGDDKPSNVWNFVSVVIYVYQIQFYKPCDLAIFYGDLFSILLVKYFFRLFFFFNLSFFQDNWFGP